MTIDLLYWLGRQNKIIWAGSTLGLMVMYVCVLKFLDIPQDMSDFPRVNPIRTLLGAIATGLITAQALIFTITLVAAQLNARYSHSMISSVFTWPTALLMSLYMFSSIYSMITLAVLSMRPTAFIINFPIVSLYIHPVSISICLAATCLILLIPYLWSFKSILNPEYMASHEYHRQLNKLHKTHGLADEDTSTLSDITLSAFGYRDYRTFEFTFERLADLALVAWQQSIIGTAETIHRHLVEITINSIEDPRCPRVACIVLGEMGEKLIAQSSAEGARQVIIGLSEVGEIALENGNLSLTRELCAIVSNIGETGAANNLGVLSEESAYSLGQIGGTAAKHDSSDLVRQISNSIRRVGYASHINNQILGTSQSFSSLWHIGACVPITTEDSLRTVSREIELLEQTTSIDQSDRAYESTPQSDSLASFRKYYIGNIRGSR